MSHSVSRKGIGAEIENDPSYSVVGTNNEPSSEDLSERLHTYGTGDIKSEIFDVLYLEPFCQHNLFVINMFCNRKPA